MKTAVFTKGSTLKHILVMTGASTVGLLALFTVDLVDMYFLSLLGHEELAAAIGFSGTLLFFLTSVGIGLQIGMGALVARAEGRHDRELAGRYYGNLMLFSALLATVVMLPVWIYLEDLFVFLGASGLTLELALDYSRIILPSTPLLACGMCAAAALRAVGDARRSMWTTMGAAAVNAVLDPILIFGMDMGIQGAATASVISRLTLITIGAIAVWKHHQLGKKPSWQSLRADLRAIVPIAGPAMLTNLATPIGSSYVLKTMATFGDSAVAGAAILGRIAPVAFALIFALSGSVGPIIGQNAGADLYRRVRQTLYNALLVNAGYVLLIWLAMFLLRNQIIDAFGAEGDAAHLIDFYATWLVIGFAFNGMLFVANAASNNLNRATQATMFNFARALLGTVPLVYLLSDWFGAVGVIAGEMAGSLLWGTVAYTIVLWQVRKMERHHEMVVKPEVCVEQSAQSPYSSARSQMGGSFAKSEE
ncbi:MATE family efflux transporter [Porticoccaceae bacterium LTM1]|nr:MATE family efflux transporter [Porticoccaceae bacterium LTM1]